MLYGFSVDYVEQHGYFMKLKAGIHMSREVFHSFQMNMLTSQRIPGLLELQVESRNEQVELLYRITGKRMLSQKIRAEKITLLQFYQLLSRTAAILEMSKEFMLRPQQYILKEDFIYCGTDFHDLYLTYIPVEHLEGKASVAEDLHQLASRLVHKVEVLEGSGYQELMSFLQDDAFHLDQFQKIIQHHIQLLEQKKWSGAAKSQRESAKLTRESPKLAETKTAPAHIVPGEPKSSNDMLLSSALSLPFFLDSENEEGRKNEANDIRKSPSWLLYTVLSIVALLVWKLGYDLMPTTMLRVTYSAAVVIAAAGTAVFLVRQAGNNRKTTEVQPAEDTLLRFDWESAGILPQSEPAPGDPSFLVKAGLEDEPLRLASVREDMDHEPSPHRAVAAPATVLLRPSAAASIEEQLAYLERLDDGSRLQIRIDKPVFLIGRSEADAELSLTESGVSRIHAEIITENDSFMIRDLGSSNGTRLNGKPLVPYLRCELSENDVVEITSCRFIFKLPPFSRMA